MIKQPFDSNIIISGLEIMCFFYFCVQSHWLWDIQSRLYLLRKPTGYGLGLFVLLCVAFVRFFLFLCVAFVRFFFFCVVFLTRCFFVSFCPIARLVFIWCGCTADGLTFVYVTLCDNDIVQPSHSETSLSFRSLTIRRAPPSDVSVKLFPDSTCDHFCSKLTLTFFFSFIN